MTMFFFDYFNKFEIPNFTLENPDGTVLYNLGTIYDRKLTLKFNALSEFSFIAPQQVNGVTTDYYDKLEYRRIVNIENIGKYMIMGVKINNDGITETKEITCNSRECELGFKKLSLFEGTFTFSEMINTLLDYAPGWEIGSLDASLLALSRTFEVTDKSIYEFLMSEASQSYQCIFTFDSINRTISADTVAGATTLTDIYMGYDNLVESTEITEKTDELVTALNVFGGGDLSIRVVNPIGTDTIYNFDYYKTTDWMSSGLISALDDWETEYDIQQPIYASELATLITKNSELVTEQAFLTDLQTSGSISLVLLEGVQKVRIQQGLSSSSYTDPDGYVWTNINAAVVDKRNQISVQEGIVNAKIAEIEVSGSALRTINTDLDLSNPINFSPSQQIELSNFIVGSTFTNVNFIQTDIMSASAVQEQAQDLYDQAVGVLIKVSQPRYTFDVNSINFVFLKEFQKFIDQLVLGAVVTVEVRENVFSYPALLSMELNYDDPTQFKLVFSNRLRLDDGAFEYSDLFNSAINAGITTTFNSNLWANWNTNYRDDVSLFIRSALDASRNAVVNATNQEFLIDKNGLRGRYAPAGDEVYSPEQVWLVNNMLAFTEDAWTTSALALGKVNLPVSGSAFGIVASVVVGTLVASNSLLITNSDSTVRISGSSARFVNTELEVSTGNSKILLNATDGIKIQKKNGILWDNQFYVDASGNAYFLGDITGASGSFTGSITATGGTFAGMNITPTGFGYDSTHYLHTDGDLYWGRLRVQGSSASFVGNIWAANLQDYVQGTQIQNIIASTITTGTMSADRIYGGTITWAGGYLDMDTYGTAVIHGNDSVVLNTPGNIYIDADTILHINGITSVGETRIYGQTSILLNGVSQNLKVRSIDHEARLLLQSDTSGQAPKVMFQNIGNTDDPYMELQFLPDNALNDNYLRVNVINNSGGTMDLFRIYGNGDTYVHGKLYVQGDQTGGTKSALTYDEYDDILLLEKWRNNEELPFEYGDILNTNKLLRDSIYFLAKRVENLEKGKNNV